MKNFFLILLLALFFNSCVSFDRKLIKDDMTTLKKENVSLINGEFEFKGYEHINAGNQKSDRLRTVAEMLNIKNPNISESDKVSVKAVSNLKDKSYEVQFMILKNDSLKYSFKYDAKFKKGVLVLKNHTVKCHGIPYLLGGCRGFKSRIGLTGKNDLFIQDYYNNDGAFLLIMGSGYSINYVEKYKRIQ